MAFLANVKKYQYGRGYHYFYDLNSFARLEGHPSYAIDSANAFNSTYSKEDTVIGDLRIRELINRAYIHLPIT